MRPELLDKLEKELQEEITSERQVVYIFCLSRKLLEDIYPDKSAWPKTLRLYCNWALHVELTGKDTIESYLKDIDEYVGRVLSEGEQSLKTYQMIIEVLLFDRLRIEFSEFFRSNTLPTDICEKDEKWSAFISSLVGVINDGRLLLKKNDQLNHISEVWAEADSSLPRASSYGLSWYVVLKEPTSRGEDVLKIKVANNDNVIPGLISSSHSFHKRKENTR